MTEKRIPDAWVGREVLIARTGVPDSELVTLEGISELGIACTYDEGDVTGEPVFFPWSSVSWMRPSAPEDRMNLEESEE